MATWSAELSRFCGRERARAAHDAVNSSAGNRALRSRWIQRRLRPHQLEFPLRRRFWNDRISCLIVVSGVWRFYRDDYYKGPYWDLGPGYYESFFAEKGPDDVVSSFQCIALT